MEALISVIVPIYKVEKYLKRCVDSIINQTYKNLEIILVDDGSPDGCGSICDEYAEKDSRVRVIHKENGGLSDARNAGLDIAAGEYIGFVDSDDYIAPEMYEVMLGRLTETGADTAVCNCLCTGDMDDYREQFNRSEAMKDCVLNRDAALEKLTEKYGWVYVTAWNKLYKKRIFDNIRFPKGKIHEDEFIIHRVIGESGKIACINQRLYYYFQRRGSIMSARSINAEMDACEAFADRARYCLSIRHSAQAVYYLDTAVGKLMLFCREGMHGEPQRRRYKSAQKEIRHLYRNMLFKKMPLNTRAALTLACMGEKPYNFCLRMTKIGITRYK